MSEAAPVRVGIVGAGTVGGGTAKLLLNRGAMLAGRGGVPVTLAKVAELDKKKALDAGIPENLWVSDYKELISDSEIDLVCELVGGTGIAEAIVHDALAAGKAVVTANKALLAEKGKPLFALAMEKGKPLAFEAAVAGGIPIILALREGLVANNVTSLLGIVNGTCNYILTEMIEKGVAYEDCLKEAQALGYAEADPTFDVEGYDAGHKLVLLSALALDTWVPFGELTMAGVNGIDLMDVQFAANMGYAIKLLAVARPDDEAGKVFLSVHPALLPKEHPLANIHGSLNAIALHGDVVQESILVGRGAGEMPTASAVVADIVQCARALRGAPMPAWQPPETPRYALAPMREYATRYYLRFLVEDQAGILGKITGSLGSRGVSIASVMQYEHSDVSGLASGTVPVTVLTHTATEGDVLDALEEIGAMAFNRAAPVFFRIES